MKTYRINGSVVGGKYLGEVMAESAEQAIEKAYDELNIGVSLCHLCADECENADVQSICAESDGGDSATDAADLHTRVADLEAKNAEWEQKARNWMATPEAAKRLDGYREMAARVAELEDALLEIDKWQTGENNIEDDEDWEADEVLRRRVRAIVKQALAGRKEGV